MNLKSLFLTLLFVCPSLVLALPSVENETMWKDYALKTEATLLPSTYYETTTVADVVSPSKRLGFIFVIENNQQTDGMYWCLSDNTLYALSEHEKKLTFLSAQPQDLVTKYGVSEAAFNETQQRIDTPLPPKKWTLQKKIAAAALGVVSVIGAYYLLKWFMATKTTVTPRPGKELEIFHGPFKSYNPIVPQAVEPSRIPEEILGQNISLRRLQVSDIPEYDAMMSTETVQNLYVNGLAIIKDAQFTEREIKANVGKMEQGKEMAYVIVDNTTQRIIGGVTAHFENTNRDGSLISQWLNEKYRGKGYIQEALKLLTTKFFELTGKTRVSATARVENTPSVKALQKAGFYITDRRKDSRETGRLGDYFILELQKG